MKFTPHNYQAYCIDRMVDSKSLGLMLDMGLGKTVITLTAINELKYNRFAINKVLVIAPKKVAESTWGKEVSKWEHLSKLRISLVLGNLEKRIKALCATADIYVINRENVQWLVDYCRNRWVFDMVVIDEFSSFKSNKAKRFKALSWVRPQIDRIVGLTGTPAPNGLLDIWSQIYLLDGGERLGKSITWFKEFYFDPDKRNSTTVFSYKLKDGAEEKIKNLIGDICISMKAEDYLELPECTYLTVPVVLDKKASAAYEKLECEMLLQVEEDVIDAGSMAILTNKLLQLANGAVYTEDRKVVEIHDCKIESFLECVEGLNGQPALVFYSFKHDVGRLQKALAKHKYRVRTLKTPEDEQAWNNREVDIMLAHPASSAYGLNLQDGGNHVIWFGLTYSLELYLQANKRLHRQGQKQKVFIHHLVVENSRDVEVMQAIENKNEVQEILLNSLKARINKYKKGR